MIIRFFFVVTGTYLILQGTGKLYYDETNGLFVYCYNYIFTETLNNVNLIHLGL